VWILKIIKRVAMWCFGVDIYRVGYKTIQIIHKSERKNAWFSPPSILSSIMEDFQVDLVLDIGANKGQFVRELRRFYRGLVVSYEPVSSAFTELRHVASQDKKWFVFNYALGSESREQIINISNHSVFSSLLETNKYCTEHFGKQSTNIAQELVSIRSFDEVVSEIPFNIYDKKIFLKMDTQGYDLEVFRGVSCIRENLVVLQSEVSHKAIYHNMTHWIESINEYEKAGFTLAGFYPVNTDKFQFIESNCIMVRMK